MRRYRVKPAIDRFMVKVEVTDGCWQWLGYRQPEGYGQFRYNGRLSLAHRVSYLLHVGPIPDGLTIDHLCRNTSCVNPAHMEPVTMLENIRRRSDRVHCKRGHVRDENRGWRGTCKACRNESARRRYARRQESQAS